MPSPRPPFTPFPPFGPTRATGRKGEGGRRGDIIGLFYEADGLTISLNLGGVTNAGIVWSVHRIL